MKFTPQTEEEMNQNFGLLYAGDADFEVVDAIEKKSKSSGNLMIELKLKAWDSKGDEGFLFDYITAQTQWKLKHFLETIGCGEWFEAGEVHAAHLIGRSGKCILKVQKSTDFGDKMVVKDYFGVTTSKKKENKKLDGEPPAFDDSDFDF